MSQLWQALEALNDVATSHLSWRLLLGESFEENRDLLVPINELAAALPVPNRPYEWLEISEFEEGVFEGYNQKTEEYVPVDRRDIVCYEFSFCKLAGELAALVGFEVAFERLGGPMYRFRLGHFGNPNGSGFSLYLAKVSDPRRLDWCIDALLAETQRPFVLFLTSMRMLNSRNERALLSRGCLVLSLELTIERDDDGQWSLSNHAKQEVVTFRNRVCPSLQEATERLQFPTPNNAKWQDVAIQFIDGETVSVAVGGVRNVVTYTQMGLLDGRNGKPSKQWELLRAFADNNGMMSWKTPGACRENQKRKELLAQRLQKFFAIPGEPFELTSDKKGWRSVFAVAADR
jgi:hypothetical protein